MKHTLFIAAAFLLLSGTSCNNAGTGTPGKTDSPAVKTESKAEKNRALVKKGYDQFPTHDAKKVWTDASPDLTEYYDGSMPPAHGDSAVQALAVYFNSFPDLKADNAMFFADDNGNVIVVSDYSMTFKNDMPMPGGMPPIKATGKSATFKEVDIFTVADNGKVTSHRSVYPMGALFMQLGVDMSKMQPPASGDMKKGGKK